VAQTTLTIPASTALGTYYVLAQADSANVVAELVETNNLKASAAMKVGSDLSVTVLTSTSYVGAGDVVNVNDTTANLGATDAPESTTRFYFSVNTTLDASDPLLASRTVPPLDAGATSAGTVQVTIPASTATGTYYVFANADDNHEIAETSETNNSKRFTINVGPDLSLVDIDTPVPAEAGGPLNVTDSVKNLGGGVAPSTQTSYYLSTNATWEAGDVYLGSRTVPSVAAGQTSTATTPVTVPVGTASGSYYLIAKADYTSSLVELLETNNLRASGLFKIGPDLSVSILNAPATVVRGTAFTITDTTRNDGSAVGSTTTSYYLSLDNTLDASDVLIGGHAVGALATATGANGQASVVIPASQAAGTYYLFAKSDSGNVAAESNETNNTRSRTIRVN
jgi:subtilase family serine protease